jgi:putative ABC transport system ATP-binding protein
MNAVEVIGLVKEYDDRPILNDFAMTAPAGSMSALVGPSGSGKSTLLNIIGLLDRPTRGDVVLFGEKNIRPNSKRALLTLRYKIGYLFQNYALIENETVASNLAIALKYRKDLDKKKEIDRALKRVGLEGFADRKIYSLSGGEQQRIALARVMLKPCELILADEPTGNLDDSNKEQVISILNQMNSEGKTVIVVTHDSRILHHFDSVVRLSGQEQAHDTRPGA